MQSRHGSTAPHVTGDDPTEVVRLSVYQISGETVSQQSGWRILRLNLAASICSPLSAVTAGGVSRQAGAR